MCRLLLSTRLEIRTINFVSFHSLGGIVFLWILLVGWFVRSFLTLAVISRTMYSYKSDLHEIWHRCSASRSQVQSSRSKPLHWKSFNHSFVMSNTHRRRRRDETVELRRVGGVNTPVGSRDPVYNFLCWQLTSDDIIIIIIIIIIMRKTEAGLRGLCIREIDLKSQILVT